MGSQHLSGSAVRRFFGVVADEGVNGGLFGGELETELLLLSGEDVGVASVTVL